LFSPNLVMMTTSTYSHVPPMSLTELPPEIIIIILSFLPVSSLGVILRLNKKWFLFIDENQNTIYRDAAYLEGYVPGPGTLLEGLGPREDGIERQGLYSRRVTDGLEGWKDFCAYRNYCLATVA
jgi:hypothetical protein